VAGLQNRCGFPPPCPSPARGEETLRLTPNCKFRDLTGPAFPARPARAPGPPCSCR
jgi:hypothetical protein